MFDIGWSELLLIAVVAIIVVGPKDLPDMLRNLGRGMRAMRRMATDFQGQFNDALKEAELDGVKDEFNKLRNSTRDLTRLPDLQSLARDEIKNAIESKPASPAATETFALPEPQLPEMREPVIDLAPPLLAETPKPAKRAAAKTGKPAARTRTAKKTEPSEAATPIAAAATPIAAEKTPAKPRAPRARKAPKPSGDAT